MRISKFNSLAINTCLMLCFVLPVKAHEKAAHEHALNEQHSNLPVETLQIQSLQVTGKLECWSFKACSCAAAGKTKHSIKETYITKILNLLMRISIFQVIKF